MALVLPSYLCSGALDPGSPRLQRNVVSDARPHGNVFHMPKDPDGKKIHYKSQSSYQRNSGLSTVGDKQAQGRDLIWQILQTLHETNRKNHSVSLQ